MALEFKISAKKVGSTSPGFDFSFRIGCITSPANESAAVNSVTTEKPANSDISAIAYQLTIGDVYDCYIGDTLDDSNKLGFQIVREDDFDTSNSVGCLKFFNEDTGCFFTVPFSIDNTKDIYLCLPYLGADVDFTNLTISSMSDVKSILTIFREKYQMKVHDVWTYGMCRYNTAFFVAIWNNDTLQRLITDYNNSAYVDRYLGYYHNLMTYWNWHTFITGKRFYSVQYLETADHKKIYCGLTVSALYNDHILQDYTTPYFESADTQAPPKISYDFQSGTDLTALLPTTGSTIALANGSVLTCRHKVESNRHYYYYEIVNNVETPQVILSAAFNVRRQTGDLVNSNYTGRFDTYSDFDYITQPISNYNYTFHLACVNLMISPNIHGDMVVTRYISENEDKPESFWNKFPDTPLTICGVYTSIWNMNSADHTAAERLEDWIKSSSYMDLMVMNITGYKNQSYSSYSYFMNLFSTIHLATTQISSINTTNGGKIDIDNADNCRRLWGISDHIKPDPPDGGEGSIGGGGSGDSSSGGEGTFDDDGDDIDFGTLPPSLETTDFITNWYLGTLGSSGLTDNLHALGTYMNSFNASEDYDSRIANIASLKVVYAPSSPLVGSYGRLQIRNTALQYSNVAPLLSQYSQQMLEGIHFNVDNYFGSFLDYAPYTKIQIYLPFAGTFDLNPSDVVGKNLVLLTKIDWLSGNIIYLIRVNDGNTNTILYRFTGNCAVEMPITSSDYGRKTMSIINTVLSGTVAVAGAVGLMYGGVTSPLVAAGIGGIIGTVKGARDIVAGQAPPQSKGSFGSSLGAMDHKKAYLIITRPKMVKAETYGETYGYPSMYSIKLNRLTGYIKVRQCNWSGFGNATDEEIDEIDRLLKSEGAII